MYLQNPKDEHRIFDSLSLRAHYSYERPDVPSSFLQSTLPMPQPLLCLGSGHSPPLCLTNLHEESRLDKFREPLSLSPVVLPSKPEGEKLDLALSSAAATLASSSLAYTFTHRSRPLHPSRSSSDGAFPVTPDFELLFSQV
jgi:hypothetical protein